MTWFFSLCWFAALAANLISALIALIQPWIARRRAAFGELPPVTIVVPMYGIEPELRENLDRIFEQDYPDFEIAFAFTRETDPAIDVARDAMSRHPRVPATVYVGDTSPYLDPKLRNEFKCLVAAKTPFIYIVDSNVALPANSIRRSIAQMAPNVGVVTACPIAVRPGNFVADVEAAFINALGARAVLAGSALGLNITVGKSMLIRWSEEVRQSVVAEFDRTTVEDVAVLFAIRRLGLEARYSDATVDHPIGVRTWTDVWNRHVRWAMYRRRYYPIKFFLEAIWSLFPTLIYAALGASALGLTPTTAIGVTLLFWFSVEWTMHLRMGWAFSWRTPLASFARELLLPAVWLTALCRGEAVWKDARIPLRGAHDAKRAGNARKGS